MKATVVGQVADLQGFCVSLSLRQGRYGPELVRESYARPAVEYRSEQAARIVLDLSHGKPIGTVTYLEHLPGSGLWAVAAIDAVERLPDAARWFSPNTLAYAPDGGALGHDIRLSSLALTDDPGSNAAQRVTVIPGDLRHVAQRDRLRRHPEVVRGLVTAALCNKNGPSVIHGRSEPVAIEQRSAVHYYEALPLPNVVGGPGARPGHEVRSQAPRSPQPQRYRIVDGERVPIEHRPARILSVF